MKSVSFHFACLTRKECVCLSPSSMGSLVVPILDHKLCWLKYLVSCCAHGGPGLSLELGAWPDPLSSVCLRSKPTRRRSLALSLPSK